ncbi:MAG: DNA repair protein RadC [SAR324 cluster bacterium]|nr:DNA repair protein RadC [SAR324 cluster bacterium]
MQKQTHFFQALQNSYGGTLAEHPWTAAQLTASSVKLISRKNLAENMLTKILQYSSVSEDLTKYAGLQPLYEGINMLNPHYCRRDEVLRMLENCSGLNVCQQEQLTDSVMLFLQIVKKTKLNPLQLHEPEALDLWWQIFPESKPWDALKWLWEEGMDVPHSQSGFRAWRRFSQGPLTGMEDVVKLHPKNWLTICAEQKTFTADIEADRTAAAFAGAGRKAGLAGICGVLPDCENCALSEDCLWSAAGGKTEQIEIEEKILKNHISVEDIPELLAWLLGSNLDERKALMNVVNQDAPLKDWSQVRLRELEQQQPSDSKLAIRLEALRQLCKNYGVEELKPQDQFNSSREIFNHFQQRLEALKQEQFIIVLLDNKHRYLAEENVTKGILNKSLVHPREVFASAIEHRAAALICVHNHPSGDPAPSPEDLRITERLVEVGKLVGIPVLDHVIIGREGYVSFVDKGIL